MYATSPDAGTIAVYHAYTSICMRLLCLQTSAGCSRQTPCLTPSCTSLLQELGFLLINPLPVNIVTYDSVVSVAPANGSTGPGAYLLGVQANNLIVNAYALSRCAPPSG